jgi:energy-coupling factor transporter transmembrane protein EcfT
LLLVLVVFPREHFILLLLPFVFLVFGYLLKSIKLRHYTFSRISFSVVLLTIFAGIILKFPIKSNHPNNVDFYNFLNKIKVEEPLKILSNDNFGFQYFDQNFERIGWNPSTETILEKVKSENIDVISIYRLDLEVPTTREFVNKLHKQTGYLQVKNFESQKRYLWVRPALVSKFQ